MQMGSESGIGSMFADLAVSVGLGLLIGIQREQAGSRIAGVRTFPLLTMLGTLCAWAPEPGRWWMVGAGMVGVSLLTLVGNLSSSPDRHDGATPESKAGGVTTEAAMVLMYVVGVTVALGHREIGVAVGVAVAVLLHAREYLHGLVARLGKEDLWAMLQFGVVTLIVLPVVPDRVMGPFGALNPRQVWLMVTLVVGLNLVAYVAHRLVGRRHGALLAGALGGLISSTATTASFSRRARESAGLVPVAGAAIMLATTILYARILFLILIASRPLFEWAWKPFGAMLGVSVLASVVLAVRARRSEAVVPTQKNPAELGSALLFAGLYAVVVVAVGAAMRYVGHAGVYLVSALSGVVDLDAITLSNSRLVQAETLNARHALGGIILASGVNLIFKAGLSAGLGGWRLVRTLIVPFGMVLVASGVVLWLWVL
ncbi:MAG: MgtC/SapB family protein [Phycisphaerales bacterium]|nr:MAG: MgtC/SapB family protein [Phycisphaerales bacterium]